MLSAALVFALTTLNVGAADQSAFGKAVGLYNQKNYTAALTAFLKIGAVHPESATPIYYQALCYQQLGDASGAKNLYQSLVTNFPESPEAKLANSVLIAFATQETGSAPRAAAATSNNVRSSARVGVYTSQLRTQDLPKDPKLATELVKNLPLSDEEWRQLPDDTKVPFSKGTSTHIFVDGYVNGRLMHMMFDTGAENCHFGRPELNAAGISYEGDGPKIPVSGVGGTTTCSMMMADISVGDIKRHLPILVNEKSVGFPIIGETFFKDFRYEIDNSQGFIRFIKKPKPGMASHAYESTDVTRIPFESSGNNMVVTVKVNGRSIPMFFDTGANSITLNAMHAAQLGISIPADARPVAVSGAGGTVRGYMFYVDRMELGPIMKTHVPIIVNESMTPPLPLLGQPFYKDKRFTIDNDEHVIKFAH